jgi:hypothetical protein
MTVADARTFRERLLIGQVFKSLVSVILEDAGYEVYPYGYESVFAALKGQVAGIPDADTLERIRSMPDLLVLDLPDCKAYLAEVKHRAFFHPTEDPPRIHAYQQYWPDSFLIVVTKEPPYFYAEAVSKIPSDQLNVRHFRRMHEIFTRIQWDTDSETRWGLWVEKFADLWASFRTA